MKMMIWSLIIFLQYCFFENRFSTCCVM